MAAAASCGTLGTWCERPGLVQAYFHSDDTPDNVVTGLEKAFAAAWRSVASEALPPLTVRVLPAVDWLARWRETAHPFEAAPGLWVTPPEPDAPGASPPSGVRVVVIRPGQGFGTGTHPTTRALLRWIAAGPADGDVLDVGTGSGLLALAALAFGARRAVGVEIDPAAVENAAENRTWNGAERFALVRGSLDALRPGATFDRVLANLDRRALGRLVPALAAHVAPGGRLGLAGLLEGEEPPILGLAAAAGLTLMDHAIDPDPASGDGWWSGWLARSP